jgi:hypothetical protein
MARIENWVGIKVQGCGTRNNHRILSLGKTKHCFLEFSLALMNVPTPETVTD